MTKGKKLILLIFLTILFSSFVIGAIVIEEGTYTNESFNISGSGNTAATGITQDGTYFWIADWSDNEVYKYYMNGTYTNESFDTSVSGDTYPIGVTQNGTYFWIVASSNDKVEKYYMNGTYTNESFNTVGTSQGNYMITNNGTYFWIVNGDDIKVYKYYMNGTYTNESFDVSGSGIEYPTGITQDGTYFWIIDDTKTEVDKYYMNGTYTNESFDISGSGNMNPFGIVQDGTYFWIVSDSSDLVYKYYMEGSCIYECTLFDSCYPDITGGLKNCTAVDEDEECNYTGDYTEFQESCNYCTLEEEISRGECINDSYRVNTYLLLNNATCCALTGNNTDCNETDSYNSSCGYAKQYDSGEASEVGADLVVGIGVGLFSFVTLIALILLVLWAKEKI